MRRWRIARALVALCTLPVALQLATPSAAVAEGGLEVSSVYTYTVDPVANVVHVVADMSFHNAVADRTDAGVVSRTYYDAFSIPLPVEAVGPVATEDGGAISAMPTYIDGTQAFYRLSIAFSSRLFFDETAHVRVTYDITGQVPRASAPTRVNGAYVAFSAFGIGDPGRLTVEVIVPAGYEIDTLGADAVKSERDGNTVYTASDIDQPQTFNLFVSARNDAALTTENVATGSHDFVLRAWPGDTEWQAFVEQAITTRLPALVTLVGLDWPVAGTTEIREAFTPYLYGYAGWFDPDARELEIGEKLDAQTIVHELSHAWFNRGWFDQRWISEGLAQEYAALVDEEAGSPPKDPDAVEVASPNAFRLNEWTAPTLDQQAAPTEAYGYNAAWFVIDGIVDDIGPDAMRRVFAAADADTIAYVGDAPPEASPSGRDWRRFLDLVEEVGGSTKAANLLRTYALTDAEGASLVARSRARDRYAALESEGGEWAAPLAVREAMASWDFEAADTLIDASTSVLEQRAQLQQRLDALGVPMVASDESTYENAASDLDDVSRIIADQIEAADEVVRAADEETASRGLLTRIGLYGDDPKSLLDTAKDALARGDTDLAVEKAQAAVRTLERSDEVGRTRLLTAFSIALALLLALLLTIVFVRHRRGRQTTPEPAADTL